MTAVAFRNHSSASFGRAEFCQCPYFEPGGLTQLCALRYGAVPLVGRVGGLSDAVVDANDAGLSAGVATGIQFTPVDQAGLDHALNRLERLWANPKAWAQVQRNGMRSEVGWAAPAKAYAALYREVARV